VRPAGWMTDAALPLATSSADATLRATRRQSPYSEIWSECHKELIENVMERNDVK